MKTYTLVLGAIPSSDYSAGWLAGSVIAHKIYCDGKRGTGKVFWACPFSYRGVSQNDKAAFKRLIRNISDKKAQVGEPDRELQLKLNSNGYFYDGDENAISWCFNLEGIFLDGQFVKEKEINNDLVGYKQYIGFREIQLSYPVANRAWFLISNIQHLRQPYGKVRESGSVYKIPRFKLYTGNRVKALRTYDFMPGGPVLAIKAPPPPERDNGEPKDIIDRYLKNMFLARLSDETLKERAIQLACAYSLMEKHKWTLQLEHKLAHGRPDIIFTENKHTLIVVEIKRDDNYDPVNQLNKYIRELKKEKKYSRYQGVVICGKKSKELVRDARRAGFKVLEFSLSINFPDT